MKIFLSNLGASDAIYFLNQLNQIQVDDSNKFEVSISDNATFTPLGMLLISSSINIFSNQNFNMDFSFDINQFDPSIQYAGHMGFFKASLPNSKFGKLPGQAFGNENYIPISRFSFENNTSNMLFKNMPILKRIENEAQRLAKILSDGDDNLIELFTFIFREMIRNSDEHGKVKEVFYCAQKWKQKKIAEVAILDNGIGYYNSLKNKYKNLRNDEDAIRLAVEPGVTESYHSPFSQEEYNSGFGLYNALEICNELKGEFCIISGTVAINYKNGGVIVRRCNHQGSAIMLRIDTSVKFNYSELLNKIVCKGEEKIRKRGENAKASELSRGKLLLKN